MAGFRTHFVAGLSAGTVIAVTGFVHGQLNNFEAAVVLVLGTLGGLLPDLDSDTGKPLQLLFRILSIIVPVCLYPLTKGFVPKGLGQGLPFATCYFICAYLSIHYLVCPVIKRLTAHRGIMHSLPFTLLCGELAFLLLDPSGRTVALYVGIAVLAGSLAHLVLDEICSLNLRFGIIPVFNRSSGSALALYSSSLAITLFVYILLTATSVTVVMKLLETWR